MAIREILSVLNANMTLTPATDSGIHAGMAVARDSSGYAVKADRKSMTDLVGLAADDVTRTSNGFIQADPVGSTGIDASGNFVADNNGMFTSVKRALADYQDESVSNISDLTSGANGYQGPRRGIGVYTTPSGQFVVDAYDSTTGLGVVKTAYKTASATTDQANADSVAINDYLTFGATDGAGAGYLIKLDADEIGTVKKVARVDDVKNGLIYITMLMGL